MSFEKQSNHSHTDESPSIRIELCVINKFVFFQHVPFSANRIF